MNAEPRPDLTPDLMEPEQGDARLAARERFVHGLLDAKHQDLGEANDRRIAAVLERLGSSRRPSRWRIAAWPVASAAAAALALIALITFSSHTSPSALATVQASIKASRTAGDRRYDVRLIPIGQNEPAELPRCTIDIRDPDHFVIKARGVFHGPITMGRDAQGDWAIKREGTIDRFPPRHILQEWMSFGPSTVMLVAVDDFLGSLEESYHLSKEAQERAPFAGGAQTDQPLCDRITAKPKAKSDGPERVEIWVDAQTFVVRRIEVHWPESGMPMTPIPDRRPGDGPPSKGPPPPGGPGDGPRRPPPRRDNPVPRCITFELVEAPALDAAWFTPEAHGR